MHAPGALSNLRWVDSHTAKGVFLINNPFCIILLRHPYNMAMAMAMVRLSELLQGAPVAIQ